MESYGEYTVRGKTYRYKKFLKISTNSEAYFIGYMACDGGYLNGKHPRMRVNSTERYIMEDFRDEFCPDSTIYKGRFNSSKKVKATNAVYELGLSSKLRTSLNNFGVFCYKKERRVVGIPNKFFLPYLAGVIDADGFIAVGHRKDCRTPRLRFFVTHQSGNYLSDLQKKMVDLYGLPTFVAYHHHTDCYRLSCQHTSKNIVFLRGILPFLKNRKKIKILSDYLNQYDVPQISGELRETYKAIRSQVAQHDSTPAQKVQRLDGEYHEQ